MPRVIPPTEVRAPASKDHGTPEAEYTYAHGQHDLRLRIRGLTEAQVGDFLEGTAEFALVVEGPLILLGARFGGTIPWSFAPYSWHLTPREARSLPPVDGPARQGRTQLDVVLVDGDDASIRATTCCSLWFDFSRALEDAIREQARMPFAPMDLKRSLNEMRRRSATAGALVARAACRCTASR